MNTNIGFAKSIVSKKLMDSIFNNTNINESKNLSKDFFETIKDSKILQLEFKLYDNIENKQISDDVIASRYIDTHINLFENFTIDEIEKEHKKLEKFIGESNISDIENISLYENINNIIVETAKKIDGDIELLHESFVKIKDYIKSNKKQEIVESEEFDIPEEYNDKLIELAINKFNEKYSSLNEDELKLIQNLISLDDTGKENLLNTLKESILNNLEIADKNGIEDKINETIQKVKDINFNQETVIKDITGLYEFNKNLI